jgi:hypothetical protein
MKKCLFCGNSNKESSLFCESCGTKLPQAYPICPHCKRAIKDGVKFCEKCGAIIVKKDIEYHPICPHCGKAIQDKAKFCKYCGKSIMESPSTKIVQGLPSTKIAQTPAKKFWKFDKMKTSLILSGGFLIILLAIFIPLSVHYINRYTALAALPKENLSSDQQRLLAMVGYPEEFIIIFDEGNANTRTETWVYEDMERYFAFQGGTYTGGEEITSPELKDDKYKVVPEDFVYALSPADVATLIGSKGDEHIDKTTGLKVIKYAGGLIICSFSPEDALIGVSRTRNIIQGEE